MLLNICAANSVPWGTNSRLPGFPLQGYNYRGNLRKKVDVEKDNVSLSAASLASLAFPVRATESNPIGISTRNRIASNRRTILLTQHTPGASNYGLSNWTGSR
jgi:hypothetical protein